MSEVYHQLSLVFSKSKRVRPPGFAESRKQYAREWGIANRDKRRASAQRYRARHPERVKKQQDKYYADHAKERTAYSLAWLAAHPDVHRLRQHERRARKRGEGNRYTAAEWEALKDLYGHQCLCCGLREPEIQLTADHVVPLARGGKNHIDNIQPLCMTCNIRKNARTVDYRKVSHEYIARTPARNTPD